MKNPFLQNRFQKYTDPHRETGLEKRVRLALERAGVEYEHNIWFGRYCVDFYLPAYNAVIEADGARWHPDPTRRPKTRWAARKLVKGAARDTYFDQQHMPLFHLTEAAIKADVDGAVAEILRQLEDDGNEARL